MGGFLERGQQRNISMLLGYYNHDGMTPIDIEEGVYDIYNYITAYGLYLV